MPLGTMRVFFYINYTFISLKYNVSLLKSYKKSILTIKDIFKSLYICFAHSIICSIFAETIIKDLTDGAYAPKRAQAIFPNSPTFFPYTLLIIIKHT